VNPKPDYTQSSNFNISMDKSIKSENQARQNNMTKINETFNSHNIAHSRLSNNKDSHTNNKSRSSKNTNNVRIIFIHLFILDLFI
jgi:hypothetical protein